MDPASYKTSNPSDHPPSYAESQRQLQGQAGARTVESFGDSVFKWLKDDNHLPYPLIKAVLERAIGLLPEGTVSYTSDSVKKSTFTKLVGLLKKHIGEDQFERIANTASSTVSKLNLGRIIYEITEALSPNETAYFAKTFLEPNQFERYQGVNDLGQIALEVLISKYCDMPVSKFLARLNPEFCDIDSLSLSENA